MDEKSSRDRHDIHVNSKISFYAPVLMVAGIPLAAIGFFVFACYVIFNWHQFVMLTAYLPALVGILVGVPLSVWMIHTLVGAYHKMGLARQEHAIAVGRKIRATTVLVEQESYTLVRHQSGELELLQPVQDSYKYNIRVPESAMLPPPTALPQLSGRQLIQDGHVEQALAASKYLLGYDAGGQVRMVEQGKLYNLLLAGIPGSGKSTTGLWLAGQRVRNGGLYMASDPHLYFQDDQGRKSLGESLAPFSTSRLIETDDGSVSGLFVKLNHLLRELSKRQKPGYVVRAQDNWIWIIDEFNSVIDAMDDAGKTEQFAKGLALLQREGRKFGLHSMIMGHRFSRDDIGKVKIRSVASNILEHKMTDINQAKTLIGSRGSKASDLQIGDYLLSGIIAESGIEKIHTPLFETVDMPLLFGASTPASGGASRVLPNTSIQEDINPLGKYASGQVEAPPEAENDEDFMRKVRQVLDLERQPAMTTREIIRRVWGIEYQGRSGQAAAEELKIIRKFIADRASRQI